MASVSYRMIVKTAAGVTLEDEDNISSHISLALDLANSTDPTKGDALVMMKRTATDAVALSYHAYLETTVYNVRDFGAVCDGATDDSSAFAACYRAAMTRFSDNTTAAAIYVPNGNMLITQNNFLGALDFTTLPGGGNGRNRFTIFGDGYSSKITFKPTSATDVWAYDNGSASSANNRLVQPKFANLDIKFDVTNLSGGATMNGFRLYGSPGNAVQGFEFEV